MARFKIRLQLYDAVDEATRSTSWVALPATPAARDERTTWALRHFATAARNTVDRILALEGAEGPRYARIRRILGVRKSPPS